MLPGAQPQGEPEREGRLLLAVRAQSARPPPRGQIFCLRERELHPAEPREPVERVPVAHLSLVGPKISVALDRPQRKRCELLVLRKPRNAPPPCLPRDRAVRPV